MKQVASCGKFLRHYNYNHVWKFEFSRSKDLTMWKTKKSYLIVVVYIAKKHLRVKMCTI